MLSEPRSRPRLRSCLVVAVTGAIVLAAFCVALATIATLLWRALS